MKKIFGWCPKATSFEILVETISYQEKRGFMKALLAMADDGFKVSDDC